MLNLKHDIQIHLKKEKEVFRLVRLLLFTFLFSLVFLGMADYIWNIALYRLVKFLVPWLIAVPAIINCVERKKSIKDLLGAHILRRALLGVLFGACFALIMKAVMTAAFPRQNVLTSYTLQSLLYNAAYYYLAVAPSEELIYRVACLESLEDVIPYRWVAFVIADLLFAGSHLFQVGLFTTIFNLFAGAVYIALYKWKRGGYVLTTVMHGTYDFLYVCLSVLIYLVRQ